MGKAIDTLSAGQVKAYQVSGNYLNVIKSTQLLEVEFVKRNDGQETHYVKQGSNLYEKDFDSIVVTNVGGVSTDIHIVTGVGKLSPSQSDSVVTIDSSSGPLPVDIDESQLNLTFNQQAVGATLNGLSKVSISAGASGVLAVANANRKYLRISVLGSSDCEFILLGGTDSNTGGVLERGMIGYEETSAAISAFNPSLFPVDVYLLEVLV